MPTRTGDTNPNAALGNLITQRIAESLSHRITFAEYMELALYHPQYGYYAANNAAIGAKGDFFTSSHLGADFGELLAEQFVQMWQILGQPMPFTLIEMGAGQGLLAVDILRYLQQHYPDCLRSLDYVIVERAAALIAEQKHQIKQLGTDMPVRWTTLAAMPPQSVTGCFFSNELVDALPVHQVVLEAGVLKEVYVTTQAIDGHPPQLIETSGELSTPQLADYFSFVGIDLSSPAYPDRYRTEVNLAALDWLCTVADRLMRGYVLTIDYGYTSDRYYSPNRREGTLQCYYQHAHHSDPYIHIGQQDITAHADFTALTRQGGQCGMQTLGFIQQGLFLMALGLGDRLATLGQSTVANTQAIQALLQRREALHTLINPMGLGNFGVLLQSKGLTSVESVYPLKGLSQPLA